MEPRVDVVYAKGLCVGCGLCSAACPSGAIAMRWTDRLLWRPEIQASECIECGLCYQTCPHAPENLVRRAARALADPDFGLGRARFFVAHAADPAKRLAGASGGFTGALLEYLLISGLVSSVVCSRPVEADFGRPHFEAFVADKPESLAAARSSHYHPISYHQALAGGGEGAAVTGVPCVINGLSRLPTGQQPSIRFKIGLCCSHNVTGAFVEALARERGLRGPFIANLRDKVGVPNANQFNNCFQQGARLVRANRYRTGFTRMWRNYFFARECCLYCPDFFAADADLAVKDAWGPMSADPLGLTLVIARNQELAAVVEKMAREGLIEARECGKDDILASQPQAAQFKQRDAAHRMALKPELREEMTNQAVPFPSPPRSPAAQTGRKYRAIITLSEFFFFRLGWVPARSIIAAISPVATLKTAIKKIFRAAGFARVGPVKKTTGGPDLKRRPRVLIAGGYGYGNIGDEAQLATNLQVWMQAAPEAEITVLSPNPPHTRATHGVSAAPAPRVVFFHSDTSGAYMSSSRRFKLHFFLSAPRILAAAALMRGGLRSPLLRPAEFELLDGLRRSDLLFLSGGGYLTGMTLSRLWDNMLLILLARSFGTPVVLSGQTIGVFKDRLSPLLARAGLGRARLIYLRDPEQSRAALTAIGVSGDRVKSTFDDALFYEPSASARGEVARRAGITEGAKYWAVNAHFWGQAPEVSRQVSLALARALDRLYRGHGRPLLFVPMHPVDEGPIEEVRRQMTEPSLLAEHGYDFDRGIAAIRGSELCITLKHHPIIFALGGGVPAVAIALDDYYAQKNGGALQLFGLGELALMTSPDRLEEELVLKVDRVMADYAAIAAQVQKRKRELEPLKGEAIKRWLTEST